MEQESARVERKRSNRPKSRKSLAESPLRANSSTPQKRRARRAKTVAPSEDDEWPIKDITAEERRADGKLWYKIDWEDDPRTGESFPESWEPAQNATDEAVRDWERKKKQRREARKAREQEKRKRAADSEGESSLPEPDDSQPIRTAKRQRVSKAHTAESPEQVAKKPWRRGTAETARFQSASQEDPVELPRKRLPSEIKDSYEEERSSSGRRSSVQVVVRRPENFDPSEYQLVESSQPSQPIQPSQSSYPSLSTSNPALSAAPPRPRSLPRPFLWDEDIEVPETQELPGSSSYRPPETQIAEEGPERATNTQDPVTSTELTSRDETSGSNSTSRLAEPSDYRPSTSDIGNTQFVSEEQSTGESLNQTQLETSQEDYLESQVVTNSSSNKVVEDSLAQSLSTSNPEVSHTTESRTLSGERSNSFWAVVGDFRSEVESQIPAQAESPPDRQPDYPELSSSFPFQTQLSLLESEGNFAGAGTVESAGIRNAQSRNDPAASAPVPPSIEARQSSILRSESPQRRSIPQTQASLPSVQEVSQAATAISLPAHFVERSPLQTDRAASQSAQQLLSQPQPRQNPGIDGTISAPTVSQSSVGGDPAPPIQPSTVEAGNLPRSRLSDSRLDDHLSLVIPSVESAPQVSPSPQTPRRSPFNMDSQSNFGTPTLDTKALMKQARAAASAKRAAEAVSREASTLPPSPSIAVPNQMLPLRETVTEPAAAPPPVVESAPSPKSSPEPESDSKGLRILPQGPNDYIVPLPMVSQTRDMYMQTIKNYKQQHSEFLSDETSNPSVIQEIDAMLDELGKLCDHSDLIDDDFSTQRAIPVDYQAKYAETVSTKCIFVAEFIDAVRPYAKHIVVVARSERMQEILEALLNYHGFEREDPSNSVHYHDTSGGPLKVSLFERGITEQSIAAMVAVEGQPTPVVVSFDSPSEYNFRGRPELPLPPGMSKQISLISLVVTHSIEHLDLCIDKQGSPFERKQLLVDCITQLQEEVGKLGSDYPSPPEAAAAIAAYLVNTDFMTNVTGTSWPIPTMPEIMGLEFAASSQTQSRSDNMSSNLAQSHDLSTQGPQWSGKRQLGLDDAVDSDSPKRQRLSPLPTSFPEQSTNRDVSHISNTALQSSSDKQATEALEAFSLGATLDYRQVDLLVKMINELQSQNAELREPNLKLQTQHEGSDAGVETQPKYREAISKIKDLEQQLRRKDASEAELRERNTKLEARCKDLETGVKEMQPKYQEALNDRGHFEYEITESLRRESTLRKKHDDRVAELAKIREQNNTLEAELIVARARLSNSSIPEVAALERKDEEIRAVKADNERLQRRFNGAQNEVEFMRNQYQEASTAHGGAHRELTGLREEVVAFRTKAQEDKVRIHEIYVESEVQQHLERIKELKAENGELQAELDKKIEELKAASNRRGTRGASVPRSPRMGSATMSPGPQRAIRQVMSNIASGNRSRGSSPAPGEVPPRTQFGEPLFQGPPRTWGNHLQG